MPFPAVAWFLLRSFLQNLSLLPFTFYHAYVLIEKSTFKSWNFVNLWNKSSPTKSPLLCCQLNNNSLLISGGPKVEQTSHYKQHIEINIYHLKRENKLLQNVFHQPGSVCHPTHIKMDVSTQLFVLWTQPLHLIIDASHSHVCIGSLASSTS